MSEVIRRGVQVDWGYGMVDWSNSRRANEFSALVGNARDMKYQASISSGKLSKNLVVEVDGKKYFVGDLARRQTDSVVIDLNEDRYDGKIAKVLIETALWFACTNGDSHYLMTGLPINYFKTHAVGLKKTLEGIHPVKVNGQEKKPNIEKVDIIPQPVAVAYDLIFDDNGKITGETMLEKWRKTSNGYEKEMVAVSRKKLAMSQFGVADMGFGTTDLAVLS